MQNWEVNVEGTTEMLEEITNAKKFFFSFAVFTYLKNPLMQ